MFFFALEVIFSQAIIAETSCPSLSHAEEEKGTPRCLRKLYLATQAEVERGVRLLAEQSYERMLDTEQLAAGGAEGNGHSIHKAG